MLTLITPTSVTEALRHVRQFYPTVDTVVFFRDGRWLYFDAENETPEFGTGVDVRVLEDAQTDVENRYNLPIAFGYTDDA